MRACGAFSLVYSTGRLHPNCESVLPPVPRPIGGCLASPSSSRRNAPIQADRRFDNKPSIILIEPASICLFALTARRTQRTRRRRYQRRPSYRGHPNDNRPSIIVIALGGSLLQPSETAPSRQLLTHAHHQVSVLSERRGNADALPVVANDYTRLCWDSASIKLTVTACCMGFTILDLRKDPRKIRYWFTRQQPRVRWNAGRVNVVMRVRMKRGRRSVVGM